VYGIASLGGGLLSPSYYLFDVIFNQQDVLSYTFAFCVTCFSYQLVLLVWARAFNRNDFY